MAKRENIPIKPDLRDMQKLADELMEESDRGCALLAVGWLENAVKDLVALRFFANASDKIVKKMFGGNGPFASFYNCINYCYLSGLISANELKALDCLRNVRNVFAHSHALGVSFDDDAVRDLVENASIALPTTIIGDRKTKFATITSSLIISISHMRRGCVEAERPQECPEPQWQ